MQHNNIKYEKYVATYGSCDEKLEANSKATH